MALGNIITLSALKEAICFNHEELHEKLNSYGPPKWNAGEHPGFLRYSEKPLFYFFCGQFLFRSDIVPSAARHQGLFLCSCSDVKKISINKIRLHRQTGDELLPWQPPPHCLSPESRSFVLDAEESDPGRLRKWQTTHWSLWVTQSGCHDLIISMRLQRSRMAVRSSGEKSGSENSLYSCAWSNAEKHWSRCTHMHTRPYFMLMEFLYLLCTFVAPPPVIVPSCFPLFQFHSKRLSYCLSCHETVI